MSAPFEFNPEAALLDATASRAQIQEIAMAALGICRQPENTVGLGAEAGSLISHAVVFRTRNHGELAIRLCQGMNLQIKDRQLIDPTDTSVLLYSSTRYNFEAPNGSKKKPRYTSSWLKTDYCTVDPITNEVAYPFSGLMPVHESDSPIPRKWGFINDLPKDEQRRRKAGRPEVLQAASGLGIFNIGRYMQLATRLGEYSSGSVKLADKQAIAKPST